MELRGMWCFTAQPSLLCWIAQIVPVLLLLLIGVDTTTMMTVANSTIATENVTITNTTATMALVTETDDHYIQDVVLNLNQSGAYVADKARQNVNKQIINYNKTSTEGFQGELILMLEFKELNLTCNATEEDWELVWMKDGSEIKIKPNDTEWHRVLTTNSSEGLQSIFNIIRTNESDVGNYECRSMTRPDDVLANYVLRAKPRVMWNLTSFTGSHTKFVGANWDLTCKFMSDEYERDAIMFLVRCPNEFQLPNDYNNVNISCEHYNLDELVHLTHIWVNRSHNRIKLSHNFRLANNGTLRRHTVRMTIQKVNYQDIGRYFCVGVNPVFFNNMTMVFRIKDQVDSVWPVITLTCLAMYLFSLVGIYESRRVRATSLHKLELEQSI